MPYSLRYYREVGGDIREARERYKEHPLELETKFTEGLKSLILNIQSNPRLYPVRYRNMRIAHMRTFPYGVHYLIDDAKEQVVVVAIAHHKRSPNIAQQRFE